MSIDIRDFYLCTPMSRYEFMCIPVVLITPAVLSDYNLANLIHHGHVYIEISKGM